MKYILSLASFLLLSPSPLHSQENKKLDSLLKVHNELPEDTLKVGILGDLYYATQYSDVDQSGKYANARLKLARKLNYDKGIADGYYTMGTYNMAMGQGDSAKIYYRKALELYGKLENSKGQFNTRDALASQEKYEGNYDEAIELNAANLEDRIAAGDSAGIAGTHLAMARSYEKKGSYKIAYDHLLAALAIYEKIEQPLWKADALFAMTALEMIFENYDKGIVYAKEALEIYERHNDKVFQMTTLNGIGQMHIELKEFENSLRYLNAGLDLSRELKMTEMEGIIVKNLGRALMGLNRSAEGIANLKESVNMLRTANRPDELFESLAAVGEAYNSINKPNEGLPYFNEAVRLLESKRPTGNGAKVYKGRSEAREMNREFDLALQDYKEFKVLNDSVFNSEKTNQIEELRTIYDTERKEQQIALQENEIALLEQKAEISSLQKILLAGGLVLALLGFYSAGQKMKRNKIEREKVDAELAFKKKELTTHALHLAKKNEVLENLKSKAQELKQSENGNKGYQQLIRTIDFDLQDDNNWENFSKYFEQVHKNFNSRIKQSYPTVTSNELRLMALLKMNLSSKEIANILNISQEGIKKARYRLRKKLDISSDDTLQDLVISL
ncbi:MAG TPA: hypothetical protein VKN36_10455 [Eudoraea sp.]|nr:hypothetical protein [Eudoraea sp.]